ncbi:MAG TPA: hypothetical protein VI603_13995 [Saprospiraceae bacterium]|nr:hypothetical protein [Saprospiraceae bacterium]
MAELTTPFDYLNILIGEEIIYRALLQQEEFARQELYGAEWTDADQIEKSAAYFKANVLRSDFAIPAELQHCVPYPPCPWDKQEHKIEVAKIKPVVTGADGTYTYGLTVYQRTDSQNSYVLGNKVIEYINNQSALDANIRGEFNYYDNRELSQYLGAAAFVIDRYHRGIKDHEFYYLFDLIK